MTSYRKMNRKMSLKHGGSTLSLLIVSVLFLSPTRSTQSIGYHPTLNLGFNPYLSPVYGYGMGLAYGTNGLGLSKDPWTASFTMDPYINLLSKLHAKTFIKKLEPTFLGLNSMHAGLKEKLAMKKHSYYSMIPENFNYGYGKHYGSAQFPNNPYKSAYGDYYLASDHHNELSSQSAPVISSDYQYQLKPYSIVKPIVKVGAVLATAALLNKKLLGVPQALDPTGMIINAS